MPRLPILRFWVSVCTVAAIICSGTSVVDGGVIYVDDDAPNDPAPGDPTISDPLEDGSPEHPFDAIQEGIDAAVDADTVLVRDGTYTGDGNRDADFGGKLITVRSENGADDCTVDCEGSDADQHRAFRFVNAETRDAVLEGFTIRNGYEATGGGIRCANGSSPIIRNCTFTANTAEYGGGLYTAEGSPTLLGCTFVECHAGDFGGGMYCEAASPTLDACTFAENSTGFNGAGLCVMYGGAVELSGCSFTDNDASRGLGGGLCCFYGSTALAGCTFSGNRARFGAGAFGLGGDDPENPEGSLTLINCSLDNNQAEFYGGGLNGGAISLTLLGCTFARNLAGQYGGGLCNDFYSDALLVDCAFLENSAGRGGGFCSLESSDALLVNCRFHANAAGVCGGGLANEGAGSSLVNCTFVANRTAWLPRAAGGGGVYCYGATHASLSNCTFVANESGKWGAAAYAREPGAVLANCVVWYNTATYDGQLSGEPTVTYCCIEGGWPGDGNTDADPQFVRVPDDGGDGWGDDPNTPDVDEGANDDYGDLHLQAGSPCIDAADNEALPADIADLDDDGDTDEPIPFDLDGNPRFVDDPDTEDTGNGTPPIVDMGVYEFQVAVAVSLDIKPRSCPNSLNVRSHGVVPAAVCGSADFDVTQIDVDTLMLTRADGVGGSVTPLMGPPGPGIHIEDVATPFEGEPCDCHQHGGDGIDDLSLKFDTETVVSELQLGDLPGGTTLELVVTGQLSDGTPFTASDCVRLVPYRAGPGFGRVDPPVGDGPGEPRSDDDGPDDARPPGVSSASDAGQTQQTQDVTLAPIAACGPISPALLALTIAGTWLGRCRRLP